MAGKVARAASPFGRNTGAMDTSLATTMRSGHPTRSEDRVKTPTRECFACQTQAKRSSSVGDRRVRRDHGFRYFSNHPRTRVMKSY